MPGSRSLVPGFGYRLPVTDLVSFQLEVIELDASRSPKKRNGNSNLSFVTQNLFYGSIEIGEWSLGDRHRLTHQERNLLLHLFRLRLVRDAEQSVDFLGAKRLRHPLVADELDHALNAVEDGMEPVAIKV